MNAPKAPNQAEIEAQMKAVWDVSAAQFDSSFNLAYFTVIDSELGYAYSKIGGLQKLSNDLVTPTMPAQGDLAALADNAPYGAVDSTADYNRMTGYVTLPENVTGTDRNWKYETKAEAGYSYFGFGTGQGSGALIDIGFVWAPGDNGWKVFSKTKADGSWKDAYGPVIPGGTKTFFKLYIAQVPDPNDPNRVIDKVTLEVWPEGMAKIPVQEVVPGVTASGRYSMRYVTSILVNGDGDLGCAIWEDVRVGTEGDSPDDMVPLTADNAKARVGDTEGTFDPSVTTVTAEGDFSNRTICVKRTGVNTDPELRSCAPSSPGMTFTAIQIGPYPQCVGWRATGGGICGSDATVDPNTGSSLMAENTDNFAAMATQGRYKINLVSPHNVSYEVRTDNPNNFSFGENVTLPGRPFVVTATDTVTGTRQMFAGTGTGRTPSGTASTVISFDFSKPSIAPIAPTPVRLNSNTDGILKGFASYRFKGNAGQRLNIATEGSGAEMILSRVFAPDGSQVIEGGNITFGGDERYGETGVFTLTTTGYYTLELQASTSREISYRLGLAIIEEPLPIVSLSYTNTRTVNILGDYQLFRFDSTLAKALALRLNYPNSSLLSANARIYRDRLPDGRLDGQSGYSPRYEGNVNFGFVPEPGVNYVLMVRDNYNWRYNKNRSTPSLENRQGQYTVKANIVSPQSLTLGNTATGNTDGIVAYTFQAVADKTYTVMLNSSASNALEFFNFDVRNPNNQRVTFSGNWYYNSSRTFKASVAGEHTV
jgi:hypothetical protein